MTNKGGTLFTVDAATNRIISGSYSYDGSGNQTRTPILGGGAMQMSYDPASRLASVYKESEGAGAGERYAYAPDNKRVYRRNASTGAEWLYFWWGGQLLMRYASATTGRRCRAGCRRARCTSRDGGSGG